MAVRKKRAVLSEAAVNPLALPSSPAATSPCLDTHTDIQHFHQSHQGGERAPFKTHSQTSSTYRSGSIQMLHLRKYQCVRTRGSKHVHVGTRLALTWIQATLVVFFLVACNQGLSQHFLLPQLTPNLNCTVYFIKLCFSLFSAKGKV